MFGQPIYLIGDVSNLKDLDISHVLKENDIDGI